VYIEIYIYILCYTFFLNKSIHLWDEGAVFSGAAPRFSYSHAPLLNKKGVSLSLYRIINVVFSFLKKETSCENIEISHTHLYIYI